MQQTHKLCPRCATQTVVDAQTCQHCGHIYRTQFAKPMPDQTIAFTPGGQQTTQIPPQATAQMPPPGQGLYQQAPSQPFQQQPVALPPQTSMSSMIGGLQFNASDAFEWRVMLFVRWVLFITLTGFAISSVAYSRTFPVLWTAFIVFLCLSVWVLIHLRRMHLNPYNMRPFAAGIVVSLCILLGYSWVLSLNAREVHEEVTRQRAQRQVQDRITQLESEVRFAPALLEDFYVLDRTNEEDPDLLSPVQQMQYAQERWLTKDPAYIEYKSKRLELERLRSSVP